MKKKKKKVKIKYKNVRLKLSERQISLIDHYCRKHKSTRNKFIKSSIKDFLSKYDGMVKEQNYVTENQLQLFDEQKYSDKPELDIID
jgi:hypothetical protein